MSWWGSAPGEIKTQTKQRKMNRVSMSSFGCASGHTEELALLPLLGKWCKQDLSPGDVNTIMEQCDNETKLLNTQPLVGIPSH